MNGSDAHHEPRRDYMADDLHRVMTDIEVVKSQMAGLSEGLSDLKVAMTSQHAELAGKVDNLKEQVADRHDLENIAEDRRDLWKAVNGLRNRMTVLLTLAAVALLGALLSLLESYALLSLNAASGGG